MIPERNEVLLEELPVLGGIAIIENANERAADIVGVEADALVEAGETAAWRLQHPAMR